MNEKDLAQVAEKHWLFWMDYGPNTHTGYATVAKNLKRIFKKHYGDKVHITVLAINYFGDWFVEEDGTDVYSAVKSAAPPKNLDFAQLMEFNRQNAFGQFGLLNILQQGHYDGVFIIQDVGIVCPMAKLIKSIREERREKNLPQFKTVFYFPVDAPFIKQIVKDIEVFDRLVTYNEYGRNEMIKVNPNLRKKLNVVPHGINIKDFFPLPDEDRLQFRKEFFRGNADKFIITNLNRNQHRKDIPCTIFGFEEYKKKNPNAFLYLHMNPQDPLGWDVRAMLWQTSLEENVDYMLPPKDIENHGAGVELVNKIYNASDVYLTTTRGEGWGLAVTEAMACRLPVIAPLHTSFHEIGDNGRRIYALENFYPICSRDDNIFRVQCDYIEVAETLEMVHDNIKSNHPSHWGRIVAAYNYVQTLHWEGIAKRWMDIFSEVF